MNFLAKIWSKIGQKIRCFHITDSRGGSEISKSREILGEGTRDTDQTGHINQGERENAGSVTGVDATSARGRQKAAESAALESANVMQSSGLSVDNSISEAKILSRAVEARGFAPRDSWLTNPSPHYVTPTADKLYQEKESQPKITAGNVAEDFSLPSDSEKVPDSMSADVSAPQQDGNFGQRDVPVPEVEDHIEPSVVSSSPGEGKMPDLSSEVLTKEEGQERSKVPAPVAADATSASGSAAGASNVRHGDGGVLDVRCPYCNSERYVKRGTRKKKNETVQLYLCRNPECGRTFTAQSVKGKHFPLNIIIEAISYYNLGLTLEQVSALIHDKFKVRPEPSTISAWVAEYSELCRFDRLRPYAVKYMEELLRARKNYENRKPKGFNSVITTSEIGREMVEVVTLAHRQLFRFRYHRAKTALMLEEFKNRNLRPLKDYLDGVSSETPHQYFQEGDRMSEIRSKFDKAEMIVKSKFNYANRLAAFVLQAVKENKARHEELQRFFVANDSVTVATEVPVYIRREDVEHMENELNFKICDDGKIKIKGDKVPRQLPRLLTGHIDLVQVRNGQIHLLDYKPHASKERPIEQLTWYALAMSRLTGLRIFEFKCGWFDEKDYYEFYPLHVVKKLKAKIRAQRKVFFKDGTWVNVPKKNELKVV